MHDLDTPAGQLGTDRPSVPTARALRQRIRRARRARHSGALGDLLTDAYVIVLLLALYGYSGVSGIRRFLESPAGAQTDAGVRYWTVIGAALAGAGLAWRGMRSLGPLLVTPALQAWVASSPVDRGAFLRPRFTALVLGAGTGLGLLGLAATVAGGTDSIAAIAWGAGAGAAWGAGGAALAVLAQAARRDPLWSRLLGRALIAGGVAIALVVIVLVAATGDACRSGVDRCLVLPTPPAPLATVLGLLAGLVALAATVQARRALGRIDRAALTAGADLAGAATAAAFLLDPSMLTRLVEDRRWRAVGRVRSRPLVRGSRHAGVGRRFRLLVRAELRRRGRDRGALLVWGALLLVMYTVAVALPSIEGSVQIILAYLAAGRLTGGLRAIARSPGLRRSLGGRDPWLHAAHMVVPGLGAIAWYLATAPVVRPLGSLDVFLMVGVILAAYRTATRPPIQHGGVVADTPFGLIPVDMLRQLFRGPDIVGILVVIELLLE